MISLISNIVFSLVALLYVDNTDLYVFNQGTDSTEEVVQKVETLLDTWYDILKITEEDLKLSKYY